MLILGIVSLLWCCGVWGQGFCLFRRFVDLDDGSPAFELKGRFIQVLSSPIEHIRSSHKGPLGILRGCDDSTLLTSY